MSTIIIGASGKKQSGKNTLCEGIAEFFKPIFGEDQVKMYSFADMLKEKVCMDVMGLTYEQCYGTDEEKNSVTTYMWERLPREIRHQNRRGENRAPNGEICEFIYPGIIIIHQQSCTVFVDGIIQITMAIVILPLNCDKQLFPSNNSAIDRDTVKNF